MSKIKLGANLFNHPSGALTAYFDTNQSIASISPNQNVPICIHSKDGNLHGSITKHDAKEAISGWFAKDMLNVYIDSVGGDAIQGEMEFNEQKVYFLGEECGIAQLEDYQG